MTRPSRPHVPSGSESEAVGRSAIGQFVYERMTMPDSQREEGDPVRQSSPPCCLEHIPGYLCLLNEGHEAEVDEPRAHHPDCPVNYFTDMPQRCRCMFMAMLDQTRFPAQPARTQQPDLSGGAA